MSQFNGVYYTKLLNQSFWQLDGTLKSTTTLGQSGINGNEDVFPIHQNSRTGVSPADGLVSYPEYLLEGSYPSPEMQSGYYAAIYMYNISMHIYIYLPIYTNKMWHKISFKLSLTGLNSEFSFS